MHFKYSNMIFQNIFYQIQYFNHPSSSKCLIRKILYLRPFLAYHLSHFLYCYIMQKQTSGRISRVPHLPPLCPLTFFLSCATGLLSCLVGLTLLSQSVQQRNIFVKFFVCIDYFIVKSIFYFVYLNYVGMIYIETGR